MHWLIDSMAVLYEKQVRRGKRREMLWKGIFTICQSLSVGYSMVNYYLKSAPSSSFIWIIIRAVLLVASFLSFLLWSIARFQLGVSLTFLPRTNGPLITKGLYSKIRNPIYLFGTISLSSYALLINQPQWLLLLILIVPMQIIRSNQEAKILRKKYEDTYEEYEKKLWI